MRFALLFVALALVSTFDRAHASCVSHCDTNAPEGCWCDDACEQYGDCCADVVTSCRAPVVSDVRPDFESGVLTVLGRALDRIGTTQVTVGAEPCELLSESWTGLTCRLPRYLSGSGHPVVVKTWSNGQTLSGTAATTVDYPLAVGISLVPYDVAGEGNALLVAADRLGLGRLPTFVVAGESLRANEFTWQCPTIICYYVALPAPHTVASTVRLVAGDARTNELPFTYLGPSVTTALMVDGVVVFYGVNTRYSEATLGGVKCEPAQHHYQDAWYHGCKPAVWVDGDLIVRLPDAESPPFPFIIPAPEVTRTSLVELAPRGNEQLTIEGRFFGPDTTVKVGGRLLQPLSVTGERIDVLTPVASAGALVADIVVHTRGRDLAVAPLPYTRARLDIVSPAAGRAGDQVTLVGRSFGVYPSAVRVGDTLVMPDAWSDTTIVLRMPQAAATPDVAFSIQGVSQAPRFLYLAPDTSGEPPVVTGFAPTAGASMSVVVISGSNLGGAIVKIGGRAANVISATPFELRVLVPEGGGAAAPVVVERAGHSVPIGTFSYAGPTITGLAGDGWTGGHVLTIDGRNFGPLAQVLFDGVPLHVESASATRLVVHVPAGVGADHTLVVRALDQSATTTWSYAPPWISSVVWMASFAGQYQIEVRGLNFGPDPHVFVDGAPCDIAVDGPGWVFCRAAGSYAHGGSLVVDAAGQRGAFTLSTIAPSLRSTVPSLLSGSGGERIEVWGDALGGDLASVTLDGLPCTDAEIVSARLLRCTTPAGVGEGTLRVDIDGRVASMTVQRRAAAIIGSGHHAPTSGGVIALPVEGVDPAHALEVSLDGVALSVLDVAADEILVTIPPGAGADRVLTLRQGGETDARLDYDAPVVNALDQRQVVPGTVLTIDGSGFGPAGRAVVSVGGRVCPAITQSHTRIRCLVPNGSGSATVSVLVMDRSAAAGSVEYPRLHVAAPSPSEGIAGEPLRMMISGSGFGPQPLVLVDGDPIRAIDLGVDRVQLDLPPDDGVGHTLQLVAGDAASNVVTFDYVAPPPDADHDGVADAADDCADTVAGDPVLPDEGCSPAQLCPCAGPTGVGSAWNDHHAFMDCVEAALDELVAADVIDLDEAAALGHSQPASCGVDPCANAPLVPGNGPAPKMSLRVTKYVSATLPLKVYLGTQAVAAPKGIIGIPLIDASGKVIVDTLKASDLDTSPLIPKGAVVVLRRGQGDVVVGVKLSTTEVAATLELEVTSGRLGTVRALSLEPDDALWQVAPRYRIDTLTLGNQDLVSHRVCR